MPDLHEFRFSDDEFHRMIAGQALVIQRLHRTLDETRQELATADKLARDRLVQIEQLRKVSKEGSGE